ncbi:MAG TPA: ABC transporter substrate-binding protein [Pyrinomonadaceae bacterium]|nr:ABC transporter substrate-binding protein [Pyrinomonadaceae bacterium]
MFRIRLIGLVALSLALGACSGSGRVNNTGNSNTSAQTTGKQGGSLVYRVQAPVKTLNYLMADDEPSVLTTLFLINGRLIELDHQTQTHVPSLAESYTTAPDGRTVDVTLRDGLKFSDGEPLTTADVDFTMKAIYDERTRSPIFRDSMMVNGKMIETKIIDPRTIQFIFPEKVGSVENYLENLVVLPKHVLGDALANGKLAESLRIDSDPKTVVTSGPFIVDSVQTGERVTLKRNPNYWKKDSAGNPLPYLETLVLEVVGDPNNTLARLQQGTIGVADRIRTSDFATLKTNESAVKPHDAGPGLNTDHIWFNLNPAKKSGESLESTPKYKWFSDKRFRKAIAQAIDRKSIAGTTLQGLATPVYGFVPAGNRAWLDQNLPKSEYDLERAKSLLTEAGFTQKMNGDKPELFDKDGNRVEFTLIVQAENEPRKLSAAVVQQDLERLGIAMQIAPLDTPGVAERWTNSFDYDAILFGLTGSGLDPSSFGGFLMSNAAVHQWHPKQAKPGTEWEAKIDELFGQQAQTSDPGERKRIFNEIQAIIAEEMPVIPITSRHIVSAANENVGNFSPSGILPFSLWNADRLFIR